MNLKRKFQAFDAIFFQAISQNDIYLVAGAEKRQQGVINGLIYVKVTPLTPYLFVCHLKPLF